MGILPLDSSVLQLLLSALSGLAGALLTYLAVRRRYRLTERTVYIDAVERMTTNLQKEIERINTERLHLLDRIADLEAESRALRQLTARMGVQNEQLRRQLTGEPAGDDPS